MDSKQNGYGHIVLVVSVTVLAILGLIGWQVWRSNNSGEDKTGQSVDAAATSQEDKKEVAKSAPKPAEEQRLSLAKGFSLAKPARLKALPDKETTVYSPTVTSSVKCIEKTHLIAGDEEMTNWDQFHITIHVCERDPSKSVRDWYIRDVQDAYGLEGEKVDLSINGNDAFKYTSPTYTLDDQQDWEQYFVIVNDGHGVIIGGRFFKGDHYSFKGDKDYTSYTADLESLAKSLQVK